MTGSMQALAARVAKGLAGNPQGRGAFIVFEGVDRSGKSTQTRRLVEHLEGAGVQVELWRFPDRATAIGQSINAYLSNKAEAHDASIHLLFSANRWEKRDALVAALQRGVTLVCDRYAHSGVAYTAAKGAPGLDTAWCQAPDAGLPAPDLVVQLQLSPDAARARGGWGQERYEAEAMQQAVARQFAELAGGEEWAVVPADQPEDAIAAQVAGLAEQAILECSSGGVPLRRLWDRQTL